MKCLSSAFATEEPCFTRLVSPPAAAGFKVKVPLYDGPFFCPNQRVTCWDWQEEGFMKCVLPSGQAVRPWRSLNHTQELGDRTTSATHSGLSCWEGKLKKSAGCRVKVMTLFSVRLIYIARIHKVQCSRVFNHLHSPL